MPTPRALLAAAIPGVVVVAVFWFWLKMPVTAAVAVGIAWALASYLVTRYLYDDADAEIAAWREEAPDLAGPVEESPR
jgi:xanthine/uracil/vitamin C permease (AzgA family)